MFNLIEKYERCIVYMLVGMMMIALFFGTLELGFLLIKELLANPVFLFDIRKLLQIFGFFFMILIGLELIETIKRYASKDHIQVEIVFLVAMIGIARKVIILDFKTMTPGLLFGIATIIISLSAGYFLIKLAHLKEKGSKA